MIKARSTTALVCVRAALAIALSTTLAISGCSTLAPEPENISTTEAPYPSRELPITQIENSKTFDEDALYSLLTAEIALTRGHYKLGLDNYVERALSSRDVNVTARATQVARILKRQEESLQMAELWKELDPGNREPRLILVSENTQARAYEEAFTEAQTLLETGHNPEFENIAVGAVDNDYQNLEKLAALYESTLTKHTENSSLRTGLSIIYQHQNRLDDALDQINLATTSTPQNVRVIYQHYRVLLEQNKPIEAAAVYSKLVELQPDNFRIRSRYAHQLLRIDMSKAMKQYRILHEQEPKNYDVLLNLALLQLEHKKKNDAEASFTLLVEGGQHLSIANFNLGEIYKDRGELNEALEHYLSVDEGNRYVDAVASAADIIGQTQGFENALEFVLEKRSQAKGKDAEELFLVEGEVLQRKGNHIEALRAYSEGISEFPDSVTLHYSRAMLYASNGQTEKAEADFKHVLSIAPESATVLNALGYTLLVQTDRFEDAATYIKRAYAINPNDPAIIDSVGWLNFKQGNPRSALKYLHRALRTVYDDEIASHLLETLWSLGKRKEARRILKEAIERFPKSPHLSDVIHRLNIRL